MMKNHPTKQPVDHASKLTPRMRAFVEAYLGEGEAVGWRSAEIAGYTGTKKSLIEQSSRLLASNVVKAEIERVRGTLTSERIMTATRRQELLSEFAEDTSAEYKDRIKAIEVLGKMQGDFIERRETTVNGGAMVVVTIPSNGRERG